MTVITKLLTLYFWLGIVALLVLLYQIAHFYQVTTGVRSHYRLFIVPIGLFFAGMVRYLVIDVWVAGDEIGDMLFFIGGVCLALLSFFLLKLMTGGGK